MPARRKIRQESHACREGGFTYFVLLAVVAAMGFVLATAGEIWHRHEPLADRPTAWY